MIRPLDSCFTVKVANGYPTPAAPKKADDRGVALVITLLLLFLLSIVGLAAVLSTSSDLLINGYYANSRGSFYAADSGVNIVRKSLQNQLTPPVVALQWNPNFTCSSITPPYTPGNGPLAANYAPATLANVLTQYGNGVYTQVAGPPPTSPGSYTPGAAASSWTESFTILNTAAHPTTISAAPLTPTVTCTNISTNPAAPVDVPTNFQYTYNYTISALGTATGAEQSIVSENGSIIVNINYNVNTNTTVNASYYGAFVTNYNACQLGPLVPGTMTGPMFTDGQWGFMPGGAYIFTDAVGQVQANACYFDWNWNSVQVPAPSYTFPDGAVVAPQFQGGFNLNQPAINQPTDSFNQEWAVIDGYGMGETNSAGVANGAPTDTDLNNNLKNVSGASYPSNGAQSGIYFNWQTVNGVPTMKGGGFYVQGNASMTLSPSGASAQVYTITNGTPAVTTTITVNPVANTTVVQQGTQAPLTLAGVPEDLSTTPASAGTMIYVNGNITGMTGPGEGQGAIQNGTAVTITAAGDVDITGDVRYVTEPVTVTQNQIPGTPPSTLIPGNNLGQDLGIFTANGNIVFSSPYHDDNLWVDGSQAVIGGNCASWSCGFLVNGCINTLNNVGGQLQTNIFGACLNVENTYYDRRYNTIPGFAPPWFPGMTVSSAPSGSQSGTPTVTLQRTAWLSSSGQ